MVFAPLALPAALGFLAAASGLRSSRLPHKGLFVLAVSLPLGLGICSLLMFWTSVLGLPGAKGLAMSVSSVLAAAFALRALTTVLPQLARDSLRRCLQNVSHRLAALDRGSAVLTLAATVFFAWTYVQFLESFASDALMF